MAKGMVEVRDVVVAVEDGGVRQTKKALVASVTRVIFSASTINNMATMPTSARRRRRAMRRIMSVPWRLNLR